VLRGLDASAAACSDYQPPVVRVAGRDPLPATVTLYVHGRPSPECYRRFETALSRLEVLSDADLVESVRAVGWPAGERSGPDTTAGVRTLVESFRQAAGRHALQPFYDLRGGDVPALAVVVRRSGTVTDLYPRRGPDCVHTVETGIERLLTGENLEALAADDGTAGAGGSTQGGDGPTDSASTHDRPEPAPERLGRETDRTTVGSDGGDPGAGGDTHARRADHQPLTPP